MKKSLGLCFILWQVLVLASCEDTLWGVSRTQWLESKVTGDFQFIRTIDPQKESLEDIKILGPGAAYILGCLFEKESQNDKAQFLWSASIDTDPLPYSLWAYEDLKGIFLGSNSYEKIEEISKKILKKDPEQSKVRRDLIEAFYWQKKDQESLDLISQVEKQGALDKELELFKAVSETRLGGTGATKLWQDFLFNQEASSLHYRAYTFFEEQNTRYSLLSNNESNLLHLKALVAEYKGETAWKLYPDFIQEPQFWKSSILLNDWEKLFIQARQYSKGIQVFENYLAQSTPELRWDFYYHLGRLSVKAGNLTLGEKWMTLALGVSTNEIQEIKVLGNLLNLYQDKSPEKFVILWEKKGSSALLDSQESLLETAKSQFIRLGNWVYLDRLWKVISTSGNPRIKASWGWVIGRGAHYGLLPPNTAIKDPGELMNNILAWDPISYPAFMVRALTKTPWVPETTLEGPARNTLPTPVEGLNSQSDAPYVNLLAFGLAYKIYQRLWNQNQVFSPSLLKSVAEELNKNGFFLESQRLMIRAARGSESFTSKDWTFRYPLAYGELIQKASLAAGIHPELFRGLVREESFYDANISSPVGALGLSQLMPTTGEAMKKTLKIPQESSLLDPEINLLIGSKYLADRLRDFGSPSKALMAYNGGQGRVRTWIREFGKLPADLFVEACPFVETRGYVKKIFLTVSLYSGIYYQNTGASALELIYPELR